MDPDKWESVGDAADSGVMVSNLPLLFADGKPTSLHTISLPQLERFIPFMVRCSIGEDLCVPWSQLPKPQWWPSRLPFRVPQSNQTACNAAVLTRLVTRCYEYHGCPYLLQFCASLVNLEPPIGYKFTDNRDGTTSMYHGHTGKLLVTFRNENREYDKNKAASRTPQSQKKLLPSLNRVKDGSSRKEAMVQSPLADVFLCDKCDDEFSTHTEIQEHERSCLGDDSSYPEILSLESGEEDTPNPSDNSYLLQVLGLRPVGNDGSISYQSPKKIRKSPSKFLHRNYYRYVTVDFSSPFGKLILKHMKHNYREQYLGEVLKYEKYIDANLDSDYKRENERPRRWMSSYKIRKNRNMWFHKMCFSKSQKQEHKITLQTGLSYESRLLFLRHCKPLEIRIQRLSRMQLKKWVKPLGKKIPYIDLTNDLSVICKFKKSKKLFTPDEIGPDPLAIPNGSISGIKDNASLSKTKKSFTKDTLATMKLDPETTRIINKLSSSIKVVPIIPQTEVINIVSSSDEEDIQEKTFSSQPKNGISHWLSSDSTAEGGLGENLAVNGTSPSVSMLAKSAEDPLVAVPSLKNNIKCLDWYYFVNKAFTSVKHSLLSSSVRLQIHQLKKYVEFAVRSLSPVKSKKYRSRRRKRSSLVLEVKRLRGDECCELNRKGLKELNVLNDPVGYVKTRSSVHRHAKNNSLTTKDSSYSRGNGNLPRKKNGSFDFKKSTEQFNLADNFNYEQEDSGSIEFSNDFKKFLDNKIKGLHVSAYPPIKPNLSQYESVKRRLEDEFMKLNQSSNNNLGSCDRKKSRASRSVRKKVKKL